MRCSGSPVAERAPHPGGRRFSGSRLLAVTRKETLHLLRDRRSLAMAFVLPAMMVSIEPGISKTRLLVHEIVSSGINRHRIGRCKDADVRND